MREINKRKRWSSKESFAQNLMWILVIFALNMMYFIFDSVGFRYVLYMLLTLYSATVFVDWLRKE